MRRTVRKQMKKVMFALLCGSLVFAKGYTALAATEAVYEYDPERGDSKVYRGIVTTDELNVRTGAGKENAPVQVDGTRITLDNKDEIAILDQVVNEGQVWYKVSFLKNETVVIGYVHSGYVNLTTDVLDPIATPTPEPTPTSKPTPKPTTSTPEPATSTPASEPQGESEKDGGKSGIVALVVVAAIAVGAVVVLWYVKKRTDELKGNETNEKIDNLKNVPLSSGPLSPDGTPIPVMKRREETTLRTTEEPRRHSETAQDEAKLLADKERARMMNEEMIRQIRNGENDEEEARLREIADSLKEKEVLKEEIDRLHIGDMVYHEYFGKGIVRDNSDVKVIEISFGQDVRFLNKASCASKRLLRKL